VYRDTSGCVAGAVPVYPNQERGIRLPHTKITHGRKTTQLSSNSRMPLWSYRATGTRHYFIQSILKTLSFSCTTHNSLFYNTGCTALPFYCRWITVTTSSRGRRSTPGQDEPDTQHGPSPQQRWNLLAGKRVRPWNRLPGEVLHSPSLEVFKTSPDKDVSNLVWPQSWPRLARVRLETSWGPSHPELFLNYALKYKHKLLIYLVTV